MPRNTIASLWSKFHRLHLGLYILFGLAVGFSGLAETVFEQYAITDFSQLKAEWENYSSANAKGESYKLSQADWIRIFKPVGVTKRTRTVIVNGKPQEDVLYSGDRRSDDIYFLLLLFWLWPLYRYYFSKKKPDLARIEKRITNLPMFVFILGWVIALQRYLENIHSYSVQYGSVPDKLHAVFAASAVIFGIFLGYLNLEVTALYIRRRIAAPFFKEHNPFGLKSGFALNLTLRYALMIFSLAMVPLLLSIYIPVLSNMDIFSSVWAMRKSMSLGTVTLEQLRIVIPAVIMAALVFWVVGFQLLSIILYRFNVQAPASALVKRMKSVAAGNFDCKSSVLYADEFGQLKGHFNMMLDGLMERDHIKDTFGRYVSMEIAEKIMKSGKVNLAGEEIQATVLFSDIRGFTPLSEKMPAPELIKFLNDYFSHITAPIAENKGVINKFIGDAVMAIFSPVFGVEDHKEAAVRAALGMKQALAKFNAQGKHPEVNFGVGIHSGGLVAGNVGTESRLEYTVLGDTVNVASRIETQTKAADTQILISKAVMDGLDKTHFPGAKFVECDPVVMKGKSHALTLYKVEGA